jgi:hypothetical protein
MVSKALHNKMGSWRNLNAFHDARHISEESFDKSLPEE